MNNVHRCYKRLIILEFNLRELFSHFSISNFTGLLVGRSLTMASFSLENDGFFSLQIDNGLSGDPFDDVAIPLTQKDCALDVVLDAKYSDISDDDFEIPSSQKRLNSK